MSKKATATRGGKPGRMLRPRKKVLKETDLIPAGRVVEPPAKFTHELRRAQPYYYQAGGEAPDGTFAAGTRVKLLKREDDDYSWVVDARGLRIVTESEGLRPLARKAAKKPK
jgi:hypothetical protein